ncbi:MAG: glycosyl transferase family protein [Chakrabartia sp.]
MADAAVHLLWVVRNEILLFAMTGMMITGLDDIIVDILWLGRLVVQAGRRRGILARQSRPSLPDPVRPGPIAIFVPAWLEADVIGDMLGHALSVWRSEDFAIFVGGYANDHATLKAVRAVGDARVRLVVGRRHGPTTKAACLNAIYSAMLRVESRSGRCFKAVLLHDAEDLVHADELRVVQSLIETADMVQLPVLPLLTTGSLWVSGHYLDEFALSHCRDMVVRNAVRAAIPAAGVGCAIGREALRALERGADRLPFAEDSLTEDYELGLRLGERGRPALFARIALDNARGLVATRAYFPEKLGDAVRQKARWTIGIALAGWDRLGWHTNPVENWMRLRDRRALWAALVILGGYLAFVLTLGLYPLAPDLARIGPWSVFWNATLIFLVWRMAIRGLCVRHHFGWRAALLSLPRTFTANIIAVMAARRAVLLYLAMRRNGRVAWDKTCHKSPLAP